MQIKNIAVLEKDTPLKTNIAYMLPNKGVVLPPVNMSMVVNGMFEIGGLAVRDLPKLSIEIGAPVLVKPLTDGAWLLFKSVDSIPATRPEFEPLPDLNVKPDPDITRFKEWAEALGLIPKGLVEAGLTEFTSDEISEFDDDPESELIDTDNLAEHEIDGQVPESQPTETNESDQVEVQNEPEVDEPTPE